MYKDIEYLLSSRTPPGRVADIAVDFSGLKIPDEFAAG